MKTKTATDENIRNTKKRILKYIGIFLIVAGLAVLAYPFYTNFILAKREKAMLSSWEEDLARLKALQEKQKNTSVTRELPQLQKETRLIDSTKKIPFKIIIPKIDLEWIVNEGTSSSILKNGPGHYIGSALPGEAGTCVVAGHRTTYGAPFNRLNELEVGDEIYVETSGNEEFVYIVTDKKEVPPTDTGVLKSTPYPSLILSTCTPKYFATRRLVVFSKIVEEQPSQ
ncbi:MAG: class E sortase [Actinobacteria bacterium]|nr:class E sortase [Actinomycetota bacterium]